jgi:predicted amidohydrolase
MTIFRIALANLAVPESPENAVRLARQAIVDAGRAGAELVCFPECFVPGYRCLGRPMPPPDEAFLSQACRTLAGEAAAARVAVVLGTERVVDGGLRIAALVINSDGTVAGWQDKVQLDPSEDETYTPGAGRQLFHVGELKFGVVICHEGWRYPETVRWAARRGAHVVFHPHLGWAEPGSFLPTTYGDPANTFHERAVLCRAAENTCYFASVNCASEGSPTTSAVARPDGTLLCCQPYGQAGLLLADIDLTLATGLLARRHKPAE